MALSRQEIARAGLALLNDVGLNGLTLRLIADRLGVKAPALYWHMKNKQELLDEMATQMYRDADAGGVKDLEEGDWEGFLTARARALRSMMLRYRDGAKVFSGTFFTDPELPNVGPIQQMVDAGFDARRVGSALFTVYAYVVGFTIEEQAVYPESGRRDERYDKVLAEQRKQLDPRIMTAVADGILGENLEDRFNDGLAILLTGLRQWLPG